MKIKLGQINFEEIWLIVPGSNILGEMNLVDLGKLIQVRSRPSLAEVSQAGWILANSAKGQESPAWLATKRIPLGGSRLQSLVSTSG